MFFSVRNNGHVADMHPTSSSFRMLDSWYHAALWFVICLWVSAPIAVSCMRKLVGLPSTAEGWDIGISLFVRPLYINCLLLYFLYWLQNLLIAFNLQSLGCIMYTIPPTRSVLSKRAVSCLVLLTTIDKIIKLSTCLSVSSIISCWATVNFAATSKCENNFKMAAGVPSSLKLL